MLEAEAAKKLKISSDFPFEYEDVIDILILNGVFDRIIIENIFTIINNHLATSSSENQMILDDWGFQQVMKYFDYITESVDSSSRIRPVVKWHDKIT